MLVDRELTIETALRALYGFSKVALAGKIYQKAPRHVLEEIKRAGRDGSIPRNVTCYL
jgi:hypothetical protein